MHRYVHLPTQEEATRSKGEFFFKSGLPGCVGCIDGTHVRIQAPSQDEHLFVNRKGFHSINVQIACREDMMIFDVVAKWPGSTHDARILRESSLYREFEEGRINGMLLGDSGYPLKRWLMTPVQAPRTPQERRYNTKHASTRNLIERCIGVLKRRFHCLHSELRMHPERVCIVIAATVVLHNICVKKRLPLPRQEDAPVMPEDEENAIIAVPDEISGRLVRNHLINSL
ncbi:hypothetical protein WMY93_003237 [Mugilogobius chulae]|uniref:Putative nuclease HARBI1 n=1 Tax=Mugilogobius chulae TaxID=88201 RepID=A0AAW0PW16_9GOBI